MPFPGIRMGDRDRISMNDSSSELWRFRLVGLCEIRAIARFLEKSLEIILFCSSALPYLNTSPINK